MTDSIEFILDGERISVGDITPTTTLLNYLRERLRRTGTKEGCAEGDCGACTVVVVDEFESQLRYRAVNSCIQFLPTLDGKILFTVESLKSRQGELHPAQQAMVECHGSQCGFCTPGFVMSLFALFKNNASPNRLEISDALSGNLCRCTGYRPILEAGAKMYQYAESPSAKGSHSTRGSEGFQEFETRLREQLQLLAPKSKVFNFVEHVFYAPLTLGKAAELIAQYPDAVILAGGTDIGLWVTKQHRDLKRVIYLGKVRELEQITQGDGHITIGASASLEVAFNRLYAVYPQLLDLYKRFASLPIRNAGTLVGNLANGSPIGDAAPALIVLKASLLLRKGEQRRAIALDKFYLDYMQNDLAAGEFVEAVKVPLPLTLPQPNQHLRVYKITKRFEQDISAVCAAFCARIEDGKVADINICYGGMAATSKRAANCEQALLGAEWSAQNIERAKQALAEDYTPLTDIRASADYRLRVAQNLLQKFYLESLDSESSIDVRTS